MNKGYWLILTGYVGWGLFPLYWTLLTHLAPLEVLLHRMLWSLPLLLLLVLNSSRRRTQVFAAFKSAAEMRLLTLSSLLICANWGIYIWAVTHQQVIEASMGYFLTPLLNVISGVLFFREKLRKLKLLAILVAAGGVGYYIASTTSIPWTGLSIGLSFAAYGLLRKIASTNPVPGLLIEILLLLPLTLGFMIWLHANGSAQFLNGDGWTDTWLILGGPVTIIPLVCFVAGTRLLPMATIGILFYVTPSLQFLSGLLILEEAFNLDKLVGFAGIWIGLALFTYSLLTEPDSGRIRPG